MTYFARIGMTLASLVVVTGVSRGQVFNTSVNFVSNGDFEIGLNDPENNNKPFVQDWFRADNGFETIFVGDDAGSGTQSVGWNKTGTVSSQFNPATWADWRSQGFVLDERETVQWSFSFKIPSTATGEVLAEFRMFRDVNLLNYVGVEDYAVVAYSAQPDDNPNDQYYFSDGNWGTVTRTFQIPDDTNAADPDEHMYVDLRFNNIFTLVTLPFSGIFKLDNVAVYRAAVSGDYNGNGIVDAADYVVWRNNLGVVGTPGQVSGDGTSNDLLGMPDGDVDSFDYSFWRSKFGSPQLGAGSFAGVPEPSAAALAVLVGCTMFSVRRRRVSGSGNLGRSSGRNAVQRKA